MRIFRDLRRALTPASTPSVSASASPVFPIDSPESLDAALARSMEEPVVIFKHSLTCSLSFFARRRILELKEASDPPVYELVVQNSRELSNLLAERMEVRHQSPQVIVVRNQRPAYHTSHGNIEAEALRKAAAEAWSL